MVIKSDTKVKIEFTRIRPSGIVLLIIPVHREEYENTIKSIHPALSTFLYANLKSNYDIKLLQ